MQHRNTLDQPRKPYLTQFYRWLLQLDLPAPVRTEAEVQAEADRNYPWNFAANLGDGVFFWFGNSFFSATTILPLFVSKLTDSPLLLGLLAVIGQGSWYLPQLFTARWTEGLARKKPVIVRLGLLIERFPLLLLLIAVMLAGRSPVLALAIFFVGYAVHGFGAGMIAPAWQDMLARCFPVNRRGRFFGVSMFLGGGIAAVGAGVSTWLLAKYAFPTNFFYLFLVGVSSIGFSWFFIALVREPVQAVTTPRQTPRQYWRNLPQILRQDHNFRRFLVARILLSLGSMGLGFVTVAAIDRWEIPDAVAGYYTAIYLVGQTVGNLVFGLLADRRGHKLTLELSALAACLGFGIAWLASSPGWYYGVFALLGLSLGGLIVSGILILWEFSESSRRPTYAGLGNTAAGIANTVAPMVGAGLALVSYGWLFAFSTLFSLAALIALRWWVKEPRRADK